MSAYVKDYPRPQFVRDSWKGLNGEWKFRFDDGNRGERERWFEEFGNCRMIEVPFTYETRKSGIGDESFHPCVWYERTMVVDETCLKDHRLMLHFEGSDFVTKVWVNGEYVGEHRGGYSRFSFDITHMVSSGNNKITVKVEDYPDRQQPRGKQRWVKENFECWYVQTTGIWKSVWMEYVPVVSLSSVKMTPCLAERRLYLEYQLEIPWTPDAGEVAVEAVVTFDGQLITKNVVTVGRDMACMPVLTDVSLEKAEARTPWGIHVWSPEKPELYDVTFRVMEEERVWDVTESYFGMREIRIDGSNILLNGVPLYQRLILDQGYWEDSHLTPPDEAAMEEDIDKIRALGYNGIRKHQKTEDERFLALCDRKGMLVWSEAPSAYCFSDTAVELFTREWMEIVRQFYNHPSIITWVPFNESWGIGQVKTNREQQHFTEAVYYLTKSMDPYRPVVANDGWEHTVSDIITLHDYEESGERLKERYIRCRDGILANEVYYSGYKSAFADTFRYRGQPVMISEFGGIAFDGNTGWGYGDKVADEEAFLERFDRITTAIKEIPYVCGYCYTQVTDVQQEVNGLMDSRRRFKVDPDKIREINERGF